MVQFHNSADDFYNDRMRTNRWPLMAALMTPNDIHVGSVIPIEATPYVLVNIGDPGAGMSSGSAADLVTTIMLNGDDALALARQLFAAAEDVISRDGSYQPTVQSMSPEAYADLLADGGVFDQPTNDTRETDTTPGLVALLNDLTAAVEEATRVQNANHSRMVDNWLNALQRITALEVDVPSNAHDHAETYATVMAERNRITALESRADNTDQQLSNQGSAYRGLQDRINQADQLIASHRHQFGPQMTYDDQIITGHACDNDGRDL